jgi:hypothetical protein
VGTDSLAGTGPPAELDVDWHYEGRWIHPTLVHGTDNEVASVYAVPDNPH